MTELTKEVEPNRALLALSSKLHGAPAWETVKFWPAMVMMVLRTKAVALDWTLKLTLPLLVLVMGESKVIHGALFETDQLQPTTVVNVTAPLPAGKPKDAALEDKVKLQVVPFCVTVKFCPSILITPTRKRDVGFVATL